MTHQHPHGVPLPVEVHWRCLTCGGTTASPLTDESRCKCADIYDQQWVRESGPAGNAGVPVEGKTVDGGCNS